MWTVTADNHGEVAAVDPRLALVAPIVKKARGLIERRECWASSPHELGGRNCTSTALGDSHFVHQVFCDANDLSGYGPYSSVINFNDTHSHAEVLAAFDRAIAYAEG